MGINLEIGAGGNPQPGYIHCDRFIDPANPRALDFVCDARRVPLADGQCDSVLMFGVFEHFGYFEVQEVILEVVRLLRPGGVFKFDVPDFDWFIDRYVHPEKLGGGRDEQWILKSIFGGQDAPGMFHLWGWNESRLRAFLEKPNWAFSSVTLVGRAWRDPEPNHLIWECVK